MSNRHRGYLQIELDKTRTLRFDLNAMAELEDQLKMPANKLLSPDANLGLKATRAMLWAGLLHEQPDLDIKLVGGWVCGENLAYVQERLIEAFYLAFGIDLAKRREALEAALKKAEEEKAAKKGIEPSPNGTGTSSSEADSAPAG